MFEEFHGEAFLSLLCMLFLCGRYFRFLGVPFIVLAVSLLGMGL